MMLDTGGAITQLSRDIIEELKLPTRSSSARPSMTSTAGYRAVSRR